MTKPDQLKKFYKDRNQSISDLQKDSAIQQAGLKLLCSSVNYNYCYNFDWLSRPIIQYPQDIIAFQEIVWRIKPDLIIETGIAHGGSLILSASLLALLDLCENQVTTLNPDPKKPRKVIGVDIEIRQHNKKEIENHPLYPRIQLLEGSSTSHKIISEVKKEADAYQTVLVCLDSNHTHKHVYSELVAYSNFVTLGSYCIVFDTVIEDMPNECFKNRPWESGNSPKTAVHDFLKNNSNFDIDKKITGKLLMTVAPDGFLKRIR